MVLLIVGAVVETLAKHMTQKFLDNMDGVKIGGAPSWYMEPTKDQMCVFAHDTGSLNSIDIAKENAHFKMTKKIEGIIDIVVYDTVSQAQDAKSKEVLHQFKKDSNLDTFVKKNMNFSKTTYEDKIKTAFVRACIPTQVVQDYQQNRLMGINSAVLNQKSTSAFESMDNEFGDDTSNKKDKFDF